MSRRDGLMAVMGAGWGRCPHPGWTRRKWVRSRVELEPLTMAPDLRAFGSWVTNN